MVTLWRLLRNRIPYELWTILKSDNEEEIEEMFLLGVWADWFPDVLPASATDPNCRTSHSFPRPPGSVQ